MSFNCAECKKTIEVGEKMHRVVVEAKWYPEDSNPPHRGGPDRFGYDIVREIACCLPCAVHLTQLMPDVVASRGSLLTAELRRHAVSMTYGNQPESVFNAAKARTMLRPPAISNTEVISG